MDIKKRISQILTLTPKPLPFEDDEIFKTFFEVFPKLKSKKVESLTKKRFKAIGFKTKIGIIVLKVYTDNIDKSSTDISFHVVRTTSSQRIRWPFGYQSKIRFSQLKEDMEEFKRALLKKFNAHITFNQQFINGDQPPLKFTSMSKLKKENQRLSYLIDFIF